MNAPGTPTPESESLALDDHSGGTTGHPGWLTAPDDRSWGELLAEARAMANRMQPISETMRDVLADADLTITNRPPILDPPALWVDLLHDATWEDQQ